MRNSAASSRSVWPRGAAAHSLLAVLCESDALKEQTCSAVSEMKKHCKLQWVPTGFSRYWHLHGVLAQVVQKHRKTTILGAKKSSSYQQNTALGTKWCRNILNICMSVSIPCDRDSTPLGLTFDNAEQHVKLTGDIARFEIQNVLLLQPHYLNSHKCSSPIWLADLDTDRQESEHPMRVKLKDQKMPVDVDRGFSAACNKCQVSSQSFECSAT